MIFLDQMDSKIDLAMQGSLECGYYQGGGTDSPAT